MITARKKATRGLRSLPELRFCRPNRHPAGFTLLEVLVAISILAVGLLGVASMQIAAINGNAFAGRITSGMYLAQATLESLLASPSTDPALAAGAHSASSPPPGSNVSWTVNDNTPVLNAKTIAVTVTWSHKGHPRTSRLIGVKASL